MEFSEILKRIVLEKRHTFIYGEEQKRSAYLKSFTNQILY